MAGYPAHLEPATDHAMIDSAANSDASFKIPKYMPIA